MQVASCSRMLAQEHKEGLTASLCFPYQALHLVQGCILKGDPFSNTGEGVMWAGILSALTYFQGRSWKKR